MGNNSSRNQRNIYQMVIIIWLILLVTVMSWIVASDLHRAKTLFLKNANLHYQQSSDRAHIIESILEGFAAMVSVTHDLGRERIRSYAQKIIEQYPHIFMFEIVEKVSHNQLESFTEYYRRNIYDQFQTSKETGMGIGLSLSRTIIEAHGGKLWVDYDHQNGALFGFELPVSE